LVVLVEKELFPLVSTIFFVVTTFLTAAAVSTTLAITFFLRDLFLFFLFG
jgi:hypothetical protein